MTNSVFINLPVKDLKVSVDFFEKLGFEFRQDLADENMVCMVINGNIFVMLLLEEFFKEFSNRELTDTSKSREVIVGVGTSTKNEVDIIADRALAAGAGKANSSLEEGNMYTRSFLDLDGHMWEVVYVEESVDRS